MLLQLRGDLLDLLAKPPLDRNPASAGSGSTGSGGGGGSAASPVLPPAAPQPNAPHHASTAALVAMDASLKQLLLSSFAPGLLELRRITYEGTGGGVLEKIARYETVHKVSEAAFCLRTARQAPPLHSLHARAHFLWVCLLPQQVRGLSDLKARLGRGRRCYALFHPRVPHEPLVFVHVALLPQV